MEEQVQAHLLKRFDLIKKVGSGAYGHVWKVQDKKTRQIFALKKVFNAFQHNTDAQRTYREVMFLQQLNHSNIIKLFMVFKAENEKDVYLLFEFMQADLHQAIRQNILEDVHKRFIVYQMFKALKYMHSAQLIHRDLKPSNILLNSDCVVKVCDFGLVRSIHTDSDEPPVMTDHVATRWYRAPQILLGSHHYDKAVDVWSLGCIVGELYHNGKPLFPGGSTLNQIEKILQLTGKPCKQDMASIQSQSAENMLQTITIPKSRHLRQFFPNAPNDAIELIGSMLSFNPHKRPTLAQLLNSPYVQRFKEQTQQKLSGGPIKIAVSDSCKLHLKQYRQLIYQLSGKRLDIKAESIDTRLDRPVQERERNQRQRLQKQRQQRQRIERDKLQKRRQQRQKILERNIQKEQELYRQQLAQIQRKKQLNKDRSAKNFKEIQREGRRNQKSIKQRKIQQEIEKMIKTPSFINDKPLRQEEKRYSFMSGLQRKTQYPSTPSKSNLEKPATTSYMDESKRSSLWQQPLQSSKSALKHYYGNALGRR